MTRKRQQSRAPFKTRTVAQRAQRFALAWHLAWAAWLVAGASILWGAARLAPGPTLIAFAAACAPALAGALLSGFRSRAARQASIALWSLGGATAALATGGAAGPFAAFCLAPLAAAAAFGGAELLPLAAAGAVAAAAIAALSGVILPLAPPPAAAAPWLSLISLGAVGLGLGGALVGLHVSARREARARDAAETGLLEILENQPQLLLGLYPGGRILDAFGQAPPGWRARDLVDRNFGDLVWPDDRAAVEDALQRAVSEGSAELAFRPAYDAEGWWELTLRRMSSIRVVGAVRDARAQRARETALEQARLAAEQQNTGKSRFLANMSHELRTPLNAIMGFSDIMRRRLFGPLSDRYAEYAELVHESGSHLLELINDVLDMSKIEADRFELSRERFDAREAISGALRLLRGQADRAGVSLRGVLPTAPMEADADRRALKQIAINLLSNALKFTPRGGAVTLTLQSDGDVLELIVADTGVGIAPDDLKRLGRPFEQAGDASQKAAGSGLGLSLVRAFAQMHGGEMCIESTLGEGTTVIVRMPVLSAAPEAPQDADAAGEAVSPARARA